MINIKFLKKNFINIVVVALLIIVLLQTCGKQEVIVNGPKIIRDTTWVIKDSTVNTKPQIFKTEPYAVPVDRWITEYIADTNYAKLVIQYQDLVKELLTTNYYKDSVKIDSLGYVFIKDTVSKNMLTGRNFSYNLKYPLVKETITIPEKKKNQLYIGGSLEGNQLIYLNQVNVGFLFKNKKDKMYGISVGVDRNAQVQYGVSTFWKIKLKK